MWQYGRYLLGILLVEVLVSRTLAHKGYAQWCFSRWSDIPIEPTEAYRPNPDDVIERSWLR
jgi:hypothetical protein